MHVRWIRPQQTDSCLPLRPTHTPQPSSTRPERSYHKAAPVFHDAGKFWACCPDKVKYDFDAFLKIPGCMSGPHCDGSLESVGQLEAQAKPRGEA
jgi:hypothetical protein